MLTRVSIIVDVLLVAKQEEICTAMSEACAKAYENNEPITKHHDERNRLIEEFIVFALPHLQRFGDEAEEDYITKASRQFEKFYNHVLKNMMAQPDSELVGSVGEATTKKLDGLEVKSGEWIGSL